MSIQKLREERTVKAKEYRHILDQNKGKLTKAETQRLDNLRDGISFIEDRIAREEKTLAGDKERIERESIGEYLKKRSGETKDHAQLNKWMRGGDRALSAEDWQHINNTMSTTTDSEGGYAVQTDVAKNVIDALKAFGGMRALATVVSTEKGNPMSWPTSDGTAEEGELVTENAAATDADIDFGVKSLPVYKYSSKVITVPIELLQDSAVDLALYINGRIAQRLGRITNRHFTVGTGSDQPTGVIAGASVGKTGASGQLTTVVYGDLVDLEHSVDPAYRKLDSCKWVFSDTVLKILKELSDGDGRPLWLPSISDTTTGTILGYGYQINQDVAVPAASAKSMAFGDFSKYFIRDVIEILYHRFTDSAYAKKGQVGFLAFMRSGGNYMDTGGAVKVFQHPAS